MKTPLFKVFQPESIADAMKETLFSGFIAEGEKVARFTQLVADYIGNPRTVLVNSCTTAITIAYRCANVRPGDEVISTPLTCVASNQPILQLGARAVWADVDRQTGMIDPEGVEGLITEKTKAILILHKEGDPARLDRFLAIGKKHGIKIVEDCAHAFGARFNGQKIGSQGDFACFSFQAIKHITTGDGGAIACGNPDDFERAKRQKWFGVDRDRRGTGNAWEQDVAEWGFKGNMNDIAATMGIEQMKHVDEIISAYNRNGERYRTLLNGIPGITQIRREASDFSTYWAYCILAENKKGLQRKLEESGVGSMQIHPRNDIYSMFAASKRELPGVDYFSERELCIPCGWWVSEEDVSGIADIIRSGW